MKVDDIDWESEFEKFKKCSVQKFSLHVLNKYDYFEDAFHGAQILPKGYNPNEPAEEQLNQEGVRFWELNYGWDMWVESLLQRCEDYEH